MSIVMLRGFSGSGKDYIGQVLCQKYGYTRFSFADSLKEQVADFLGCDVRILHTQEGKSCVFSCTCGTCTCGTCRFSGKTYREILIEVAGEKRATNDEYFATSCCKSIQESKADKIVITDWRFPIEMEVISRNTEWTITPVHVQRVGQLTSPVVDASEHALDDWWGSNSRVVWNEVGNDAFLLEQLDKWV